MTREWEPLGPATDVNVREEVVYALTTYGSVRIDSRTAGTADYYELFAVATDMRGQ